MSLNTKEKIRCPQCGSINDMTLWQSLTVSDSSDLKAELLKGKLNMFECTECSAKALVPTPFLYHDEDKKLMLSFMPTDSLEEALKQFASIKESSRSSGELNELEGYNLRFVTDYNSLLEKILIFDAGLNDKTVEVIKLMVLMQEPDMLEKRTALFGRVCEDKSIEIMVQNTEDGAIFTSRAPFITYETIHNELLKSGVKDISFDWEMVDKEYAAKLLGY